MLLPCTCLHAPEACLFGLFPHLLSAHSSFFSVKFWFPYCLFCKLLSPLSLLRVDGQVAFYFTVVCFWLMWCWLFLLFPYPVSWTLPHSWDPLTRLPSTLGLGLGNKADSGQKAFRLWEQWWKNIIQWGSGLVGMASVFGRAWDVLRGRAAPCHEFLTMEAREEGATCIWIFSSIGNRMLMNI